MSAAVKTQLLVTTHAPQFLDALAPEQVRVLDRQRDGFTRVRSAAKVAMVKNYIAEGGVLGEAWQMQLFDEPTSLASAR